MVVAGADAFHGDASLNSFDVEVRGAGFEFWDIIIVAIHVIIIVIVVGISIDEVIGVDGSWSAYLYTWNGSSYQYDEYEAGTNTCKVDVTRTYNTGGWVQLKIQNTGTSYATQISTELAPYPGTGTYTGTKYDYPAAGGAAIYRWFYVGTSPYGISSYTYGSFNMPTFFTGDL